jgi:hypothetical protein
MGILDHFCNLGFIQIFARGPQGCRIIPFEVQKMRKLNKLLIILIIFLFALGLFLIVVQQFISINLFNKFVSIISLTAYSNALILHPPYHGLNKTAQINSFTNAMLEILKKIFKVIGSLLIFFAFITFLIRFFMNKTQFIQNNLLRLKEYTANAFNIGRESKLTLVIIFVAINLIVLVNAILHDPGTGYDAFSHMRNVQFLSQFSWPTPQQSGEFFSPPLPYAIPATLYAFLIPVLRGLPSSAELVALAAAGKLSQIVNIFLSLGLTFYLLMLCETLRPSNSDLKIATLAMLAVLPVYYKTFSQARPEPYVAFFYILSIYLIIRLGQGQCTLIKQLTLGVILGLLLLSRQWAFFLFPGMVIFFLWRAWQDRGHALYYIKTLGIALICAILIGGWFYLFLYNRYGSITAFNRNAAPYFSFSNQPGYFYFNLALLKKLFSAPVHPAFDNRFFPIIYSETWGDYWGYFLADRINPGRAPVSLLAHMNIVGVFPTLLLLGGLVLGGYYFFRLICKRNFDMISQGISLMLIVTITSLIVYTWFIIMYEGDGKGDTIRATYIIYVLPFICLMAGELIYKIGMRSHLAQRIIFAFLLVVGLHNMQGLVSRLWWLQFYH